MRWGGWWGRRGKEEEGKEAVAARISRAYFSGGVWAGWVMGDGWMGWVSVCDGWEGLWLDHLWGGRRRSESLCLPLLLANSISSNLAASHSSDGHSQDITGTGKRPTRYCLWLLSRPEKKPATRTQPKKATKATQNRISATGKGKWGKKKESKNMIYLRIEWNGWMREDEGG